MNRNMTHRVAGALFQLSDAVAWVIFFFAILGILGNLLVEFVPPKAIPLTERLWGSALCALVAAGAFQLTRRHMFGLLLVMLSPFAFEFHSSLLLVVVYALLALAIFGTPFAVANIEARKDRVGGAS
jgi:hypothetical protein